MNRNSKTEIITLNYPINISKLITREMILKDPFSSVNTKVYDITCFSSVKFHLGKTSREISEAYPGYEYKIYAYRATKKAPGEVIERLKLFFKFDHSKKFIHVNVELLPQQEIVTVGSPVSPLLIPQPLVDSISELDIEEEEEEEEVKTTRTKRRQLNTD